MQDPSSPVFFLPWVGAEQGTYATVTCIVPHNKAILISVDAGTAELTVTRVLKRKHLLSLTA